MASVTAFTAERSQQIEDESINDGHIVGEDLILVRRNLEVLNLGPVIGPPGVAGPPGPTSIQVVTSGTRPGAPTEGLGIHETDTKRFYIWDGTAWKYRGGLWICTSGTRPGTPFTGLEIYETDTKRKYIYEAAAWVQKSGPPNWLTPAFANGWSNLAGFQAARYCLIDGEVRIQGVIKLGTMGQAAFTLPVGYRPPAPIPFIALDGNNGAGRLDVEINGNVIPTNGNNTYFSLNATFRVD